MISPKPFDSDELYDNCSSDPKEVTCFCGRVGLHSVFLMEESERLVNVLVLNVINI